MYVTIIAYHPMLELYNQTSCHKLKPFRLTVEFSSKRSQTISFPNHISILLSSNKTQYQNVFIEREKKESFRRHYYLYRVEKIENEIVSQIFP